MSPYRRSNKHVGVVSLASKVNIISSKSAIKHDIIKDRYQTKTPYQNAAQIETTDLPDAVQNRKAKHVPKYQPRDKHSSLSTLLKKDEK